MNSNGSNPQDTPEAEFYPVLDNMDSVVIGTHELCWRKPKALKPTFGELDIFYIPDEFCLDISSLLTFIYSFREKIITPENVASDILNFVVDTIKPETCAITLKYNHSSKTSVQFSVSYRNDDDSGDEFDDIEIDPYLEEMELQETFERIKNSYGNGY